MIKNRELYVKDPAANLLLNDGVAEVTDGRSESDMRTLRYELETFVCDGEYAKGMRRILDTFLRNIDQPTQPGVWVSGFYGSGKSHLVKMLRALWLDIAFADGATARGIVNVPTEVADQLRELNTAGRRLGGLHAASGKLGAGAGDFVRMELLNIVFRSVGLPEQYPLARFVMWLRDEGYLEEVKARVEAAGKDWDKELRNLYVSPHIAQGLLEVYPDFAAGPREARALLKEQFPTVGDVSTDEMVHAVREALTVGGKFPLTLIALDEVQQYIGENQARSFLIQEVTETCSKHFGGRLLFVGTGQTALSGTPMLQKLMGRFTVKIELSDTDVETVIRQVILAKRPDHMPAIEKVLTEHLGEISRHLEGSRVAYRSDDHAILVSDYPLLPVRRRFWERVLRAVDPGGTGSQLRSQLKVVHEAKRSTADQGLGCVVAGDFIYHQIAASLLQTGGRPREIYEFIKELSTGSLDDRLKARVGGLIFLIGKLPRDPGANLGVTGNPDALADLLVCDLRDGSVELRKRLPDLLAELEESGKVMRVGQEYRMQTRESSAWTEEYRSQIAAVLGDPQRVNHERADLLRNECGKRLKGLKVYQGQCREQRTITPHFGPEPPKEADKAVHVWIRDGWEEEEKTVISDATATGTESPPIFVFVPRRSADEIKKTLGSLRAAEATLHARGAPSTPEGDEARLAMDTRKSEAERRLAGLVDEVFAGARVFQAGGQELFADDLASKVAAAADGSVVRLYPQFDAADHPKWNKVIDRARQGDGASLEVLGHKEEIGKHPVTAAILKAIGSGRKGSEIQKLFTDSPYGWPADAIEGGFYALVQSGDLWATDGDNSVLDAKTLDRRKIAQTRFRVESVTVSALQRIKIRKLLQDVGIACRATEELTGIAALLEVLRQRARSAGGDPPRPDAPSVAYLDELALKVGNEQIVAVFDRREELGDQAESWQKTGVRIAERLPRWTRLERLLAHAPQSAHNDGHKAEVAALKTQADAIRDQRLLLADPDPVPGLCEQVTQLLRDALTASQNAYQEAHDVGMAMLRADQNWEQLAPEQKHELLAAEKLTKVPPVDVSSEVKVLESLEAMSLSTWSDRIAALPARFQKGAVGGC
ncbi:MAG: BREX system P-loop protein BrxC [Candidatus Schekmanbacteria bacterium]|nr:BREX system P-loop protein BrxC [Candidatus Schekmanbacteria bacterium]